MSNTRDTYIARQPVLDRQHRIIGYELNFREAGAGAETVDDAASVQAFVDSIESVGAETVIGSTLAFLNVTTEFIMDDVLSTLPKSQIVLQIPPLDDVYPEFLRRCRDLRKDGFRFALRSFERRDTRDDLLEIARYVKVDFQAMKPSDLKQLVRKVKRTNAMLLADG